MKKMSSVSKAGNRTATRLSRSLERNLLAYVAVATAGLASAALPADAEVVYTPSNTPMAQGFAGGALTQLDLNNDGTPDFVFSNYSYQTHGLGALFLKVLPGQPGNEIWGSRIPGNRKVTALALGDGVQVGSKGKFASYPQGLNMAIIDVSLTSFASGSWLGVETAYLGLKFVISGEVHYGWARIKFVSTGSFRSASIYGYAYETVPNQSIITGQTSGSAEIPNPISGIPSTERDNVAHGAGPSLGMLAAGAAGRRLGAGNLNTNRFPQTR